MGKHQTQAEGLPSPRLVPAAISAARHERTDLWRSISIKRLPNGSIFAGPRPVEVLRPQMRLEYGLEA